MNSQKLFRSFLSTSRATFRFFLLSKLKSLFFFIFRVAMMTGGNTRFVVQKMEGPVFSKQTIGSDTVCDDTNVFSMWVKEFRPYRDVQTLMHKDKKSLATSSKNLQ